MSRILMLNPFFLPYQGGTEKHVLEVSKRLAKKGFDITVLTVRLPGTKASEEFEGFKIKRANALFVLDKLPPFSPVPPPIALSPVMNSEIRKEMHRNDLAHIHNRFFYSPEDAKTVKKTGKRLCITLHNARTQGISPQTDFFGKLYDETSGKAIMRECDAIAAVSRNTLEVTAPKELVEARGRVIYNGVDTKLFTVPRKSEELEFKEELGINPEKKVVLCVCRLAPQKGLQYLMQGFAIARKRFPDSHLVILGTGSEEEKLRKLGKQLKLGGDFSLIAEKVPEEKLVRIYQASDAFCLPSLWEPFGIVVVEAMACGKPVIGSAIGGIPEIVSKESGFLVQPKNPKAISERLAELFENEGKAKKMGLAGRRIVEGKFTWDNSARGYEKLYGELLFR
jgi:glycosyltransferase involved in cell wall biosynthesis